MGQPAQLVESGARGAVLAALALGQEVDVEIDDGDVVEESGGEPALDEFGNVGGARLEQIALVVVAPHQTSLFQQQLFQTTSFLVNLMLVKAIIIKIIRQRPKKI